jgi:hypothetical protein
MSFTLEEYEKSCIQYRGSKQPIGNSRWICFRTTTTGKDRSKISLGIKAEMVNWRMDNFNRVADYAFITTPKVRIFNSKL